MVDDIIWKKLEGHLHVFVSIKWSFGIHVFDVCATNFGPWGTDDTVPHNFFSDHAGCTCGEFVWKINEVSANSDSNSIWVFLLGAVVNDNLCIRDSTIFWDAPDFSMGKIGNCIGANSDAFFSLGKAM